MKACLLIRDLPPYRRSAFVAGLEACGYSVDDKEDTSPDNILVLWNRYGRFDTVAKRYEDKGLPVLIAENGYLGRDWQNKHWYALAKTGHNGVGKWLYGGADRWDGMNVEFAPWRETGKEIVVLATRHIGIHGIAEPYGWLQKTVERLHRHSKLQVRVRNHPGENKCVPLDIDLANAKAVVSWGSGGALKAMLWGIPAVYGFNSWIGREAATPLEAFLGGALRFQADRLNMFRRLAWAMWTTDELATGRPFKCLLQ